MLRLLFEKTGNAVWISHLDLMRLFQRAFKRAGLSLVHTHGFNPRPSVSIALPLSVGVESCCELLDFDLEGEIPSCEEIRDRLNAALIRGVQACAVYTGGRKVRELVLLDVDVTMEYDSGVPMDTTNRITELFAGTSLLVEKKGKNGVQEQDILPMIRNLTVSQKDSQTVVISARICCQNPTLNPVLIPGAIHRYLPDFSPNFFKCARKEMYDIQETVFR